MLRICGYTTIAHTTGTLETAIREVAIAESLRLKDKTNDIFYLTLGSLILEWGGETNDPSPRG